MSGRAVCDAARRSPARRTTDTIAGHIRTIRPHGVVTFGPDGVYGHPDHSAIAQRATAAVTSLRRHLTPRNAQWFADETNEPAPREVVTASLGERHGRPINLLSDATTPCS